MKQKYQELIEAIKNKDVAIVAVTKTMPIAIIKQAVNTGLKIIGENRIEEAIEKYRLLYAFFKEKNVEFHFIGHLQSNKVKKAVAIFDMIQSLDSFKLAEKINSYAKKIGKVQRVLVQVNIGNEAQKHGVIPEKTISFVKGLATYENIKVEGLMCVPPYTDIIEEVRPYFQNMKELFCEMKNKKIPNMKYLSMGMSRDYRIAIEEGANMVRIGRAIFGER